MGEQRRREKPVERCIYCDSVRDLRNEHVIPFALGGDLVLRNASCGSCAKVTGALEQRLLRGHWWAYRRRLNLPSRRPSEQPEYFPATLRRASGGSVSVHVAAFDNPFLTMFELDPPGFLSGAAPIDGPCAGRSFVKLLGAMPSSVMIEGRSQSIARDDKLEFPVNLDVADLVRFLAKIGLGYAVRRRGLDGLGDIFVRECILGDGRGALRYVGGDANPAATAALFRGGIHSLIERTRGDVLSVAIELFRHLGAPTPVYEVVVGRVAPAV